jgi:hypothetical protein
VSMMLLAPFSGSVESLVQVTHIELNAMINTETSL